MTQSNLVGMLVVLACLSPIVLVAVVSWICGSEFNRSNIESEGTEGMRDGCEGEEDGREYVSPKEKEWREWLMGRHSHN